MQDGMIQILEKVARSHFRSEESMSSTSRLEWFSLLFVPLFCLLSMSSLVSAAALSPTTCANLVKGKAYESASKCFLRLSNSIKGVSLSKVEQKLKGLYLLNAAKLMQKEALIKMKAAEKAYYLEQASKILQQYLDEKLCTKKYKCQEVQGKLYTVTKKIKYGRLTVTYPKNISGKITLQGFKFQEEKAFPPPLSIELRPGPYRVIIEYKTGESKILKIDIAENSTRVLTLEGPPGTRQKAAKVRPEPIPTKQVKPTWPWVVVGASATVAVVGVALLGGGYAMMGESQSLFDKLKARDSGSSSVGGVTLAELYQDIPATYDTGSALAITGFVLGGLGLAGVVGGFVALSLAPTVSVPITDPNASLPPKGPTRASLKRFGTFSY